MLSYCIPGGLFSAISGDHTGCHLHPRHHCLGSRFPSGLSPAHGLSSGAMGSANNVTGADLLGLSSEKVNAKGAWWSIKGSEGWQSLTGFRIIAMRGFPNA